MGETLAVAMAALFGFVAGVAITAYVVMLDVRAKERREQNYDLELLDEPGTAGGPGPKTDEEGQ